MTAGAACTPQSRGDPRAACPVSPPPGRQAGLGLPGAPEAAPRTPAGGALTAGPEHVPVPFRRDGHPRGSTRKHEQTHKVVTKLRPRGQKGFPPGCAGDGTPESWGRAERRWGQAQTTSPRSHQRPALAVSGPEPSGARSPDSTRPCCRPRRPSPLCKRSSTTEPRQRPQKPLRRQRTACPPSRGSLLHRPHWTIPAGADRRPRPC